MTIEEKAAILSGKTVWQTREIDRFSISCCAAETKENGRLIMGAEDVWNVSLTAPEAKLYLTHMDNVAHASVTRFTMRGQLTAYGVSNYDMLEDGETVVYKRQSALWRRNFFVFTVLKDAMKHISAAMQPEAMIFIQMLFKFIHKVTVKMHNLATSDAFQM